MNLRFILGSFSALILITLALVNSYQQKRPISEKCKGDENVSRT
jgi:hypothetical protein